MGQKTGRPRKPTVTLKLHGTYREDRRYKSEPVPETAIPKKPTFLKGEAAKEWKRIAPLLSKSKCLTEWDRSLLAAYCFEWGIYVALCKSVKEYASITINGNVIQNPLLSARNRALKNFKGIAVEFGLSPSSRTRISTNPNEEEIDPFAELMKRRKNVG